MHSTEFTPNIWYGTHITETHFVFGISDEVIDPKETMYMLTDEIPIKIESVRSGQFGHRVPQDVFEHQVLDITGKLERRESF